MKKIVKYEKGRIVFYKSLKINVIRIRFQNNIKIFMEFQAYGHPVIRKQINDFSTCRFLSRTK